MCLIAANDIVCPDDLTHLFSKPSITTLAPELRLKPFFDNNRLDFRSAYAACALRKLFISDEIRDRHITELNTNSSLRDEIEIERGIDTDKRLASGKRYAIATFKFKRSHINRVDVLLLEDYKSLTDDDRRELLQFGIRNDLDIDHLSHPGLEGVWFINPDVVLRSPPQGYAANKDLVKSMPANPLSDRELEVLALAAEGLEDKEIASKLIISTRTAKAHMHNILHNGLCARNRIEAIIMAISNGWVKIPDRLANMVKSFNNMSDREKQAARLVAEGRTNSEMADEMNISVYTIKTHLRNIFRKLGTTNRSQVAVVLAASRLESASTDKSVELRNYTGSGNTSIHAAIADIEDMIGRNDLHRARTLAGELLEDLQAANKSESTMPLMEKWNDRYPSDLEADLIFSDIGAAIRKIKSLMQSMRKHAEPQEGALISPLTERESEILQLASSGMSIKDISRQFTPAISRSQLDFCFERIMLKLHAWNRVEAIEAAISNGWIKAPKGSMRYEEKNHASTREAKRRAIISKLSLTLYEERVFDMLLDGFGNNEIEVKMGDSNKKLSKTIKTLTRALSLYEEELRTEGSRVIESAERDALRINKENLNNLPVIPKNTILFHIIADSILPEEQRGLLTVLEQDMAHATYKEKIVRLRTDDSSDFISQVRAIMRQQKISYKDYNLVFDVACPDIETARSIHTSALGVKALAFENHNEGEAIDPLRMTYDAAQIEGIMFALRALQSGKIESLREAFMILSGNKLPEELASINDIDLFVMIAKFKLPYVKLMDYKDLKQLNDLIRKNIKSAA